MQGTDALTTPPASPDLAVRYRQFQEKRSLNAVASTPQEEDEESDKELDFENLLTVARSRARKERRKKRKELERQLAILREGASQSSQDASSSSHSSPPQDVKTEQGQIVAAEKVALLPESIVPTKNKVEVEENNNASVVVDAVANENIRPLESTPVNEDGTPPDVAKTSAQNMSLVTPCFGPNSVNSNVVQATGQMGSKTSAAAAAVTQQRRFMHYDDDSGSPWSAGVETRSRKKARTPLIATTNSLRVPESLSNQDIKPTSVALDLSSKSPDRSASLGNQQGRSLERMVQFPPSTGPSQVQKVHSTLEKLVNKSASGFSISKVGVSMFTTGKGSAVYVSKTSMERATTSFGSLLTNTNNTESDEKINDQNVNVMDDTREVRPQPLLLEIPNEPSKNQPHQQQNISSTHVQQQQHPLVDSIFTSGSGKRMKISSAALEKAARSISSSDMSVKSVEVAAGSNIGMEGCSLMPIPLPTTMMQEPIAEEEEKVTAKVNMVDSIFTSGSGRKCKVSAASLEKAQAQIGGSNNTMAQCASSSRSFGQQYQQPQQQQRIVPSTNSANAASSFDASPSVRLETTTGPTATSSLGMRSVVVPSTSTTTTKQFVRPRPAASAPTLSLPVNRALIQQRNAGDMSAVDTNQRRHGSTSPLRPSPAVVPRRLPVLDHRPKLPALKIPTMVIQSNSLVSNVAKLVSSSNAGLVSFAPAWDLPSGISTRPCLETLQALKNHCLSQVPQAEKSLTLEWVANHFRWIVLKLAGQERIGLNGKRLTFAKVLEEMTKRATREFVKKEYSCLWHIVGGESSPQRPMILFLSRILTMPKPTSNSKSETVCFVELSDSWYGMECILDGPLTELIRKGSLVPGQKLLVANCTLDTPLNESSAFSPLDLSCNRLLVSSPPLGNQRQPKLMVKSNASKPAPWDSRLGFYVYFQSPPVGVLAPREVSKRLAQIKPGGGLVARTDLLIVRKSLLLFREELQDGSVVVRSQQDEETHAASFEARKMEHVQSLETSFQKTIPDSDSNMSREVYQRKFNEYLAQHGGLNSNLMRPRKVTSFIRLLVRDAPRKSMWEGKTCLLTVWRPNEDTMSLIQEGRICVVTGLAVSNNSNGPGGNHREHALQQLRLHAYPNSTKWYHQPLSPEVTLEGYVPRRFQECIGANSSCDSCLIALRSSPDVIFAIRPVSLQEGDQMTIIAISPASAKTRLMFQPIVGSVFAVRDLAVKSKSVQGYVLNAVALDTTAFVSARVQSSTYPREIRESFGHLLDHLEAARAFALSTPGRSLVENALVKVDLLVKGELGILDEPSGGISRGCPPMPGITQEQNEIRRSDQADDGSVPTIASVYADLDRSAEFLDCEKSCGPMEVEFVTTPQQSKVGVELDFSGGGSAAASDSTLSSVGDARSMLMMATPQQPNRTLNNSFETPRYSSSSMEANSSWSASQQQLPSSSATNGPLLFSSSPAVVTPSTTFVSRANGGVMGPPDLVNASSATAHSSSSTSSSATKRPTSNNNVRMKLGISAAALSSLQVGKKTIEARLNRGLFSKIQPGWTIRFESGPLFQEVEVVAIRSYASFKMLLEKEPFKRVSPWCETLEHALEEFYTKNGSLDMEHSVLAFEVRCKDAMSTPELVLSRKQSMSVKASSGSSSA